jgi:hypothetical protein
MMKNDIYKAHPVLYCFVPKKPPKNDVNKSQIGIKEGGCFDKLSRTGKEKRLKTSLKSL